MPQFTFNKIAFILFLFILIPLSGFASPYKLSKNMEFKLFAAGILAEGVAFYADNKKSKPTQSAIAKLNKNDIFPIDRDWAGQWNEKADQRSDTVLYSTFALPLALPVMESDATLDIAVLYMETLLFTNAGFHLAKGFINRYRPYAYDDKAPQNVLLNVDTKRSFYSGHASHTTANAIFFAKVFSDFYPNSPYKSSVWLASGVISLYGSWQRVEAGMHFPSDVALGMLWGGLVGYWVPEWHKVSRDFVVMPFLYEDSVGLEYSYFW